AFEQKADSSPQLLVAFAPRLRKTFYKAWSGAVVNDRQRPLVAVYALRVEAPLFGGNVQKMATYTDGQLDLPSDWQEWPIDALETTGSLFLDQDYDSILPQSYVVVQQGAGVSLRRHVKRVDAVQTLQRAAYGVSRKATQLGFADDWIGSLGTDISAL